MAIKDDGGKEIKIVEYSHRWAHDMFNHPPRPIQNEECDVKAYNPGPQPVHKGGKYGY